MNKGEVVMKDSYEEFKVIKLDEEYPDDYIDSWGTVGVRDTYVCPECEYLGRTCGVCGGEDNGLY